MENEKVHPIDIEGYEGDEGKRILARRIVELRFDEGSKLMGYIAEEYQEAARRDKQRGKEKLAYMLEIANGQVVSVQRWLDVIFRRFRKYMGHELST